MGEVVDEHVRLGRLNVPGVKAPRAPLVFSQELTRSVELGIKRCDSVRDWVHGLLGQFRLPLHSLAKQRTRLPCQKFLRILISGSSLHICQLGLEGIVSKTLGSKYESGRSSLWLKTINPNAPALRSLEQENWRR